MEYAEKLLKFRAKHNLTQRQLALLFDVGVFMIYRYEKGISRPSAMHEKKYEEIMKKWEEKNK